MGEAVDEYRAFLAAKAALPPHAGFAVEPDEVHPLLKPHQRAAVVWAVRGGRRALFEAFGLGKTIQQLEILRLILAKLGGGRGLIVLPLGVRQEFRRDAAMLGTPVAPAPRGSHLLVKDAGAGRAGRRSHAHAGHRTGGGIDLAQRAPEGQEVYRGLHRGVYCSLFDDPDFQQLTPAARHVLLTIRLCAQNNASSMFRCYPVLLCVQTGYDPGTLETALRELESTPTSGAGRWIEREGVVVWIRNGLRYDPNIRLADPKHRKGVERAIAALPRLPIVLRFCDYYRITRPFEDPPQTLARPSEDQGGSDPPRPRPRPKNLETESEAEAEAACATVDSVDNPADPRLNPGPTRSAIALDSETPGEARSSPGAMPGSQDKGSDPTALADRRAFLVAQAKALVQAETEPQP